MTLSRAEKLDKIFGTPLFAVLLAIFCNVLWGCAFPFIKMGYRLFEIDPSNTASIFCFAGVRFMLGSLLVLLGSTLLQSRMPTFPKGKSLPSAVYWACGRPRPSTPSTTSPWRCSPVRSAAS